MPKSSRKRTRRSRNEERIISSRTVYRGPVFTVTTDHVEEPNGVRARRDLIHHSGSIAVLAAGPIDPGEHELHAAKRELLEETGYNATNWKRILKFYASPGFVAETMAVYLATGLRAGQAQPEDDEVIYKRLVSLPAAVRLGIGGAHWGAPS